MVCPATSQNQFSVEENCFDTYEEAQYLDKCSYYVEVSQRKMCNLISLLFMFNYLYPHVLRLCL